MKIYESHPGMYRYKRLPGLAKFILTEHLDEFVSDHLALTREMNLPLLKHISHLPDEQLLLFGKATYAEYLGFLAENQAKEQIQNAFARWLGDELGIIGMSEIETSDITGLNYLRGRLLKKWTKIYPIPEEDKNELLDEIDNFIFGSITSGTNLYIHLLQTKLQEESHFNDQLINTSPGIIFIFDLLGKKDVYINGNLKELMGYTRDEIIALGSNILSELTHPDDIPLLTGNIDQIRRRPEQKSYVIEYRFRHANGEYRWLRSYQTVFKRNAAGQPEELLGISFDITKEKEIALALEERETQLLEAQSIAQLGSFEWDLHSDKSINTPELYRIFGFQNQQTHQEFLKRVHPDDIEKVKDAITQSFVTGKYDCQYRYLVQGKEKVLWARGVVIFRHSKPVTMRGTVQDITQLKKIEDELLRKTKELEKSNESLQQFASIASHDLKEPLRKMSMYSDMVLSMEDGNISEMSQINLKKVKASSIRMQSMIEEILDFSSLTNDSKKQLINLATCVNGAKEILEESITEKQATINYDDMPEAWVIPSQMQQLFQNLISNALKFAKKNENPRVEITTEILHRSNVSEPDLAPADNYIKIEVKDNGIGFKQEYAEKIFGLFQRLHARENYEGSGLGLSICKRIVENHGGVIYARSGPDEGATFIIILPA